MSGAGRGRGGAATLERQAGGAERAATTSRSALTFIVAAVALDMAALGITVPVLPGLIKDLVGGQAGAAAQYVGWIAAAWAATNFIAAPILGRLSDRFGRRPVLLVSMFGSALDYFLMAVAPTVAFLLVARLASAATSASVIAANAYIADVSPPEQRAARFGLLQAAFGVGLIAGPIAGGLLGELDARLPFYCAGALCLLNGLLGLLALPESLPQARRRTDLPILVSPIGAMRIYGSSRTLIALACIMLLFHVSRQVGVTATVPFVAYRFDWSSGVIGFAAVALGLSSVLVQGLLVRPFVTRFGELRAAMVGAAAGTAGLLVFAFAPVGTIFMGGVAAYGFIGLVGPALQGVITSHIPPDEQGQLQGAHASLIAAASILGGPLFTEAFAAAIGPWADWAPPGLPYCIAAGLTVGVFVLLLRQAASAAPSMRRP